MQGKTTLHRFSALAVSGALTFGLTGCFQNVSGTGSLTSTKGKTSQSSFTDSSPSGGGSFDGTALRASAAIVGTYAGVDANGTYDGSYGMVINLEKSFTTAIGASVLKDMVARSGEAGVSQMPVELTINEFKVKAKFPFGKIAVDKALRNIMVIRPNFSSVDFASGYIPDTAPIVQTSARYLFSYGGVEDGDAAIARMTMFYRNTSPYGTGFLPSPSNPSWGQNFPSESDAAANAEFMRLTPDLGKILYGICTDPNANSFICDASFTNVVTSPQDYLLAIHPEKIASATFDGLEAAKKAEYTRYPLGHPDYPSYYKIAKAWVIYPTTTGPKGLLLCSSAFNGQYSTYSIQNAAGAAVNYEVADKRACNCNNESLETLHSINTGGTIPTADRQKLFDYCISNASATPFGSIGAKGVPNKQKYLREAIVGRKRAPTSGIASPSTGTVNDVTFVTAQ
jgi:hypothetical protein